MICRNCGKEFEGQFCPECGTKANELQKCPVCGKERVEGEKFCANCGYNYIQQNTVPATQNKTETQKKNSSNVSKAFTKAYWIIPAVGTLLLGVLLLLTLCAPVMLHEGYDISGIGFKHIFKVNIDYVFTVTCAIILVMSIFVIILGIARIINAVAKPYANIKDKKSYIIDGVICVAVVALGIAGAADAGNWFGSAGAGYSICIAICAIGIALVALRYVFENKFIDNDIAKENGQKIKDKGFIKNNADVKINKGIKKGSIVLASLVVIALVIGIIVSSIYINPFNATSFKTVQTRGDIIKQFGLPEGAKEDSYSYSYIDNSIKGYNYLTENIYALEEEELEDGMESESDEDLENAFVGLMKLDAIAEKLEEKANSVSYKKTTVYFNNDGGENRKLDTISSYICEVVMPKNYQGETPLRNIKKLEVAESVVMKYLNIARVKYFAVYDDGSFINNTAIIQLNDTISEKDLPIDIKYSDNLGDYVFHINNIDAIEVEILTEDFASIEELITFVGSKENLNDIIINNITNKIIDQKDLKLNDIALVTKINKDDISNCLNIYLDLGYSNITKYRVNTNLDINLFKMKIFKNGTYKLNGNTLEYYNYGSYIVKELENIFYQQNERGELIVLDTVNYLEEIKIESEQDFVLSNDLDESKEQELQILLENILNEKVNCNYPGIKYYYTARDDKTVVEIGYLENNTYKEIKLYFDGYLLNYDNLSIEEALEQIYANKVELISNSYEFKLENEELLINNLGEYVIEITPIKK